MKALGAFRYMARIPPFKTEKCDERIKHRGMPLYGTSPSPSSPPKRITSKGFPLLHETQKGREDKFVFHILNDVSFDLRINIQPKRFISEWIKALSSR